MGIGSNPLGLFQDLREDTIAPLMAASARVKATYSSLGMLDCRNMRSTKTSNEAIDEGF